MSKLSSILGFVAGSFLMGGTALAQNAAQDELIPPKATFMYNVPYGTSHGSDGQYVESGTYYNNAPVYQRTGNTGTVWSLYKRANGYWYIDFDAVSEDWSGTVAQTAQAQDWPWSTRNWNSNVVSFRTAKVEVHNIPYASSSAGVYSFSGQIYNGAPVYQRVNGGTTWSLYKRANGNWYIDFNAVAEDWDGTIAYSTQAMEWPWSSTAWNAGAQIFRTRVVYLYNLPYGGSGGSTGAYTFNGQLYNGAPVYQRVSGGTTWSLYKRANGAWHVDFNAISEDWDGTIAYTTQAMEYPWSVKAWNGTNFAVSAANVTVSDIPYGRLGAVGEWTFSGTTYNNAPVYQRVVSGDTWSLYKRADGKWYFDFNAITEDWDGTIASTTQAMDYPWSVKAWNSSATVVTSIFNP